MIFKQVATGGLPVFSRCMRTHARSHCECDLPQFDGAPPCCPRIRKDLGIGGRLAASTGLHTRAAALDGSMSAGCEAGYALEQCERVET